MTKRQRHDDVSTPDGWADLSRRDFLKAAGATGVTAGLATQPVGAARQQATTVQWVADTLITDNREAIVGAMREAGLPENIELEIIAGSFITDDVQAQFQQWLSVGRERPDILRMDSGWTIPFIARNQLLNLSENLPQAALDTIDSEYFDAIVETATGPDGNLYGVPFFPDFGNVQYRKDLVEDAGYDPEGENWATEALSWERFSEVISTVQEENDLQFGYTFQAQAYEGLACCNFNEFMSSYGGAYFGDLDNLFGPIGERPVTVAEQPVIDSIRMVRTLIHGNGASGTLDGITGGISPQAVLQWTEQPSLQPFTNGNAAAVRNWPFAILVNGTPDAFGENLGVMPVPYGVTAENARYEGTGGPTSALAGWNNTINPNSPNIEASIQVLLALMDENVQLTILEEAGLLPPRRSLFQSRRARNVPVIGRYLDTLRVAGQNAIPRPVTVVWPQESARIAQQVNGAYSQGGNPQQAMTQLRSQLRQIEASV